MRVWDSLLEEGAKILYRISVALLKLCEPDLLQCDNPGDIVNKLRQATHKVYDRDMLMKVCLRFPEHLNTLPVSTLFCGFPLFRTGPYTSFQHCDLLPAYTR